jgi:ABC-type sugar transport system substrate-binding protein
MTACSSPGSGADATGSADTIVLINPAPGSPAWQSIADCFESEAEAKGVTADVVGTSGTAYDVAATVELLQQQVALGVGAIAVNHSGGADTLAPIIKQARDAGIFIGSLESGAAIVDRNFDAGIDIPAYARLVAERISAMPGEKKVGLLSISETGTSKIFNDELASALADDSSVEIVQTVLDNGDPTKDADLVNGMLSAHPEITVIVTNNPGQIAGVSTAIKEQSLVGKTTAIGISLDESTQAALDDGTADAIAVQNLCQVGIDTVDAFVALQNGEEVTGDFPVDLKWVEKSDWRDLDTSVWG